MFLITAIRRVAAKSMLAQVDFGPRLFICVNQTNSFIVFSWILMSGAYQLRNCIKLLFFSLTSLLFLFTSGGRFLLTDWLPLHGSGDEQLFRSAES